MTPVAVFTPTFHAVYHFLANQSQFGNPSYHWNFSDEEANRSLTAAAKTCSQLCFERTLLLRLRELCARPALKRPLISR